jgi:excisionase family DNA binding protein
MRPQLSEFARRLGPNGELKPEDASQFIRESASELAELVRLAGPVCAAFLEAILKRQAQPTPQASAPLPNLAAAPRSNKAALTVKEVATMFGVAETTVRLWIGRRTVGVIRLGRSVRIPKPEIDRLVSENTLPALRR